LLAFFGLWDTGVITVDAFVEPSAELGIGITTLSVSHALGALQFQLGAEAEWDLHDATLVPIDVALVWSNTPASWLSIHGGVAMGLTVERVVVEAPYPQTSMTFAAALRAGASLTVSERFAVALDVECSFPVTSRPTPDLIIEVGPSFSF
jgi:hypothetical protein